MHHIYNVLLKSIVRVIFITSGFCRIFSRVRVINHNAKSNVYIKHFVIKNNGKKYIIAMGINTLNKKKVKNAVAHEQEISKTYGKFFKFNHAIKTGRFLYINYAIYNYFDDVTIFAGDDDFEYALNAARCVYENAKYYEITPENVDDFIIKNIQIIIPFASPEQIIAQKSFGKCRSALLKLGKVKCAPQHGDYNLPNMLKRGNDYYIVDLERTMPNMIASYDWYHLLKCKNGWFNPNITPEMKQVPYADIIKLFTEIDIFMEYNQQ